MVISENLENVVNLYRNGKITQYVLEKELTNAVQGIIPASVKIVKDPGSTNTTFGIATVPNKSGKIFSVEYLIDYNAINGFLTVKENLELLFRETRNTQKILSAYAKFLAIKKGMEIPYSEAVIFFLGLYKMTLLNFSEELRTKLLSLKSLPEIRKIEEEIEKLENGTEKVEIVLERLIVEDLVPKEFIEAAKELSRSTINTSYEPVEKSDPEKPTFNKEYEKTKSFSSSTFGIRSSQEINPSYKPSTNQ